MKYTEYSTNMHVGDEEMKNLGYVNIEEFKDDFEFKNLVNDKYFFKSDIDKLKNKDDIRLWSLFGLFEFNTELHVKFNFNIEASIKSFRARAKLPCEDGSRLTGGDWAQLSGGEDSQLAGGDMAQLAGGNWAQLSGGYMAQLAGGDMAQLAGGNWAQLAGGEDSQLSGGNGARLAGEYRAQLAGGDMAQLAGGNRAQLSGGEDSQLSGGDGSQLTGGEDSQLAGGDGSQLTGGSGSKVKAGIDSVISLCERDQKGNITAFKSGVVGKDFEPDVWYWLKDGELISEKQEEK